MTVKQRLAILFLSSILTACASDDKTADFDSELYAGDPIDSLLAEEAPVSEIEAIQRGDAALDSQNYDLALYEYIRSLAFSDGKFQDRSLNTIGEIHLARGNTELAEKSFLRALDFNPNNVVTLQSLGVLYSKRGMIPQGRNAFFKSISVDQIRLTSGAFVRDYGELTESVVAQLLIDKDSPQMSYMGLGVLADIDAQYGLAKRFYEKALEIDPRSSKTMINLGYSHYMSGNYHIAKRLMTSALQIDPSNQRALNNLALTHLALEEVPQALNVFMRQMGPAEALNNVGYFLMLHGKPEQAIPYLQQAIDKKPSYYKVANENLNRALAEVRAKSKTKIK
ncbi:hypothetical protein MACH09_22110 [Vibrio sp. MACH09]|uniref:tetratricopeptide repeat protein n=1 Tax=unclassified Vibrio TaxID=2614977 RepID=UPI00149390F0|nr:MULTISPECIES: tetratricopeptide repeat protein [unclassified Vibrio]NOI64868.1 tetratricopeptide repeat protein [Vibrio sp. 99-8-1]GLO61703.1 hypothetical protein MACH09_22110 [Vibrio sp. MACH09]